MIIIIIFSNLIGCKLLVRERVITIPWNDRNWTGHCHYCLGIMKLKFLKVLNKKKTKFMSHCDVILKVTWKAFHIQSNLLLLHSLTMQKYPSTSWGTMLCFLKLCFAIEDDNIVILLCVHVPVSVCVSFNDETNILKFNITGNNWDIVFTCPDFVPPIM